MPLVCLPVCLSVCLPLLWLWRDEVESLCEHVIAGEQEVKVNCQERESGNGMAPWI